MDDPYKFVGRFVTDHISTLLVLEEYHKIEQFIPSFRLNITQWQAADQSSVGQHLYAWGRRTTAIMNGLPEIQQASITLVKKELDRLIVSYRFDKAYALADVLQKMDNTLGTTQVSKVVQAAKDKVTELATEAKQLSSQTKLQTAQAITDGFPDPHKTTLKQAIDAAYTAATQYVPQSVPQDNRERLAMLQQLTARAVTGSTGVNPATAGGRGNVERSEEKD